MSTRSPLAPIRRREAPVLGAYDVKTPKFACATMREGEHPVAVRDARKPFPFNVTEQSLAGALTGRVVESTEKLLTLEATPLCYEVPRSAVAKVEAMADVPKLMLKPTALVEAALDAFAQAHPLHKDYYEAIRASLLGFGKATFPHRDFEAWLVEQHNAWWKVGSSPIKALVEMGMVLDEMQTMLTPPCI